MSEKTVHHVAALIQTYEQIRSLGESLHFNQQEYKQIIAFYEKEEQFDEALYAAEDAIIQYSFSLDFYLKKAGLLIANHCSKLALEVLDIASLLAPNNFEVEILRAEALVHQRDFGEAQLKMDQLKHLATHDQKSQILLKESLIFEFQGQHERVFFSLRSVLDENPYSEEALERIWACIEFNRLYEEGIKVFQKVINQNPYSTLSWYYTGLAYAYLGQYDDALEAFEFSMVCDDRFELAYRECSELYFELKRFDRAIIVFQEMIERFESDAETFLRVGQCLQFQGSYEASYAFLVDALELDHLNDEVYYHLGICFGKVDEWAKALKYFEKAIEIEDQREEYYAAAAEGYFATGQLGLADEYFNIAIDIVPEEVQFWTQYATFLLETGQSDKALELIDSASAFIDNSVLIYCRIACLFANGRKKEAIYYLGEALSEHYGLYPSLFEMMPTLLEDNAVTSLITSFKA